MISCTVFIIPHSIERDAVRNKFRASVPYVKDCKVAFKPTE